MKARLIPIILAFLLASIPLNSQDFTCQDPPYYTLDESLYGNSPSSQMQITHILIGLFNDLGLRQLNTRQEAGAQAFIEVESRVGIRQEYINGVKTVIVTPGTIRNDKKIIYFHGGGYTDELILFQWDMVVDIAKKSGSPVYLVDYRLVPDHIFPAPVEDGMAVYTELLESFDAEELVFMGDSAGGGLALALAGKLRDDGMPLPAQLILISPWLDIEGDNPDMPSYDDLDMMLSVPGIQSGGLAYAGGDVNVFDDAYASPLFLEDLDELPPTLMFIGTYEILYPDAVLFRDKAEQQGMDLTCLEVEGGFHVWLGAPAWLVPESAWARRQVASFINCHVSGGRTSGPEGVQGSDFEIELDDLSFSLYPNPVSTLSELRILWDGKKETEFPVKLTVMSSDGRLIAAAQLTETSTDAERRIRDILVLEEPGLYYITIESGSQSRTAPLIRH